MEIGDIVLCGDLVGTVVEVTDNNIKSYCCDGREHLFNGTEALLVTSYKQMLSQLKGEIIRQC